MTRRQAVSLPTLSRVTGADQGPQGARATRATTSAWQPYISSHLPRAEFQVIENSPMQRSPSDWAANISGLPGGVQAAGEAGCCCQAGLSTQRGLPLASSPVKKRQVAGS